MPASGELIFAAPRRTKPPRHLADLDPAQRRAAAADLGHREFRAHQLARPYFARLEDDPAAMADLPADARRSLVEALLPRLLIPVRQLTCDNGTTIKTVWRLFDGTLVESVLMRYPQRVTMCVSSQAGWRLESHGVTVTVRDSRGPEIDGACGQLAAQEV